MSNGSAPKNWLKLAIEFNETMSDMPDAASRTVKAMRKFNALYNEVADPYNWWLLYNVAVPMYKTFDVRRSQAQQRTHIGYETMTYQDLFGYTIVVNPDTPKRQLPSNLTLKPAFRAEYNAWLASFFGYTNVIDDGQVYITGRECVMNPRTFEDFKRETVRVERETLRDSWSPGDRNFWPEY